MKNYPLPSKISWWRLPEWLDKLTNRVEVLEDALAPPTPSTDYKLYTAILTQSGGDDPNIKEAGDSLNIGVTYLIGDGSDDPGDFMNVGAPNNDEGTSFVATGETPTKWGKTTLEYNAGAPVVTVLENTIGNVYWTYDSIGFYTGHSEELFTDNKSFALISSSTMGPIVTNISVYDSSSALIVASAEDGYRENFIAYVEIRVYN